MKNIKTKIMGIVNLSPESFSGDGITNIEQILSKVRSMINEGADIIDIGAQSTRPGFIELSPEEEIKRLEQCLPIIRKKFPDTIISLDTYKWKVASYGLSIGVNIINDVSGVYSDEMLECILDYPNTSIILMYNERNSKIYNSVIGEVILKLQKMIRRYEKKGIKNIILDPGFGFYENKNTSLKVLNNLGVIINNFNYPFMIGSSRKKFLQEIDAQSPINKLHLESIRYARNLGVSIVRVHDIKTTKIALEGT